MNLRIKEYRACNFSNSSENSLHTGVRKVKATQLCQTLCDPLDYSRPGSSVHGILQARILKWVVIPFSRGSSTQGWNPSLLHRLHWQADSLPT